MHAFRSIPFQGGVAKAVSAAGLRESESWRRAFQAEAKDSRFYEIVEQTLDGSFEHYYLVLEDSSGRTRAIQPVFFVRQNLVEGIPALHSLVKALRRASPRLLTMRVLMVGCAAGEGRLGVCQAGDEAWAAAALHAALPVYARSHKASLVVFKDFRSEYRTAFHFLVQNGYTRVPSMPMTRLPLPYSDFDDYLATLSKATRKDLRRKFRKAENTSPLELSVVIDASSVVDEIYPLYLQVQARSTMKFETLTKDYFRALGRHMPDRVRFFLWRWKGRIVAFSLCLVHDGAIYDDCLGLDYGVALDLHLYFLTFRDIIRWSIAQGLDRHLSSPLNYGPKLHLGCDLLPLDLYVMHTSPWLNRIFPSILKLLEPTRHDPTLRRFANAHEL